LFWGVAVYCNCISSVSGVDFTKLIPRTDDVLCVQVLSKYSCYFNLANPSKAALKQKKKREAKKAKKEQEGGTAGSSSGAAFTSIPCTTTATTTTAGSVVTNGDSTTLSAPKLPFAFSEAELMGDPEKLKKIKKLKSVS
jgi:hypothetical protein